MRKRIHGHEILYTLHARRLEDEGAMTLQTPKYMCVTIQMPLFHDKIKTTIESSEDRSTKLFNRVQSLPAADKVDATV